MVTVKSGAPVGSGGLRGAAKVSAAKSPRARNAQVSEQQRCRPPRSSNRENKDPKDFESMDAAREYLMSQRSGPSLQTALNWWSESAPALAVQFLLHNVAVCAAPSLSLRSSAAAPGATFAVSSAPARCPCRRLWIHRERRRGTLQAHAGLALGAAAHEPHALPPGLPCHASRRRSRADRHPWPHNSRAVPRRRFRGGPGRGDA